MSAAPILTASEAKRIAAIAARLQSDQDGEVLNAGRMLVRSLSKHGLRIGDVLEMALAPQPVKRPAWFYGPVEIIPHKQQAYDCLASKQALSAWEAEFLGSIVTRRKLTDRQRDILADIVLKVRRHRDAAYG